MIFRTYARLIHFPNRSSAVISIGAATLADIFDPAVRGKKVGINNNFLLVMTLTHFIFQDGDLLYCTTAWTGNFYLIQCQIPHLSFPRLLGPYLEVF